MKTNPVTRRILRKYRRKGLQPPTVASNFRHERPRKGSVKLSVTALEVHRPRPDGYLVLRKEGENCVQRRYWAHAKIDGEWKRIRLAEGTYPTIARALRVLYGHARRIAKE